MVNSMIPWIGGKRLMREFLIARFPPHYDKYVEVFGGAGWVLFAKKPERFEVYNDANSNLTNMFHVVKHKPMSFVKELGFLPLNSRAEFDLMLDWHRKQDFSLPYQAIRWIKDRNTDMNKLRGVSEVKKVKDMRGNPLLLFKNEWGIQFVLDRNEGLELVEFSKE